MKRFFLFFFLLILNVNSVFAQRDTDHWIAPYYDTSSTSATNYHHGLYLSTDSLTPFEVKIYNNNVQIGAVTISKGAPQVYFVAAPMIRTSSADDAFTVITKGLHLHGEKPFYASMRVAQSNYGSHGEIVTSKGKAGVGRKFYVAYTPQSINNSTSFTAGMLATENNTTINVSWNTTGVTFVTGGVTANNLTIILNKGESFLLAGLCTIAGNKSGFIGAKIESDKPITLTNGNSNGNFGGVSSSGSDLILDQSVPVERLGNTFAIVKTLSTDPTRNPEGAIVVATENNTQIFVNGSPTPLTTINEGEWYWIKDTNYVSQGTDHSNMFISTTKNVYLYQLVTITDSNATNGYNYIPPLNCFLPRKIDEIGKISEMPNSANSGGTPTGTSSTPFRFKLNILTEAGATVTVNGVPPTAAQGPFPLTGNTQWVTYAVPNITGNITVVSNKAVTAGVNGGYSTAGYGGYFAGFSSVPAISKKVGECLPGLVLEVDDHFETYQWYLNGVAIPGATFNTYTPTQVGNYTVRVTMGSCTPVTTPPLKVENCTVENPQNVTICGSKTFPLQFSSSTQTPVTSTVTIITPPANGTATIDPLTGAVTYTPTPGYAGPDTLVYKFCGNNVDFPDCEQMILNLNVVPFIMKDVFLYACEYEGKAVFNLDDADVTDYPTVVKTYYTSLADAQAGTNQIQNPTAYLSAETEIYVKGVTPEGCSTISIIRLKLKIQSLNLVDATLKSCYIESNPTTALFDLTTAVVGGTGALTKHYYPSSYDAFYQTNEILNPATYIAPNGVVYVRVKSTSFECFNIAKIHLVVLPPSPSPQLVDKTICMEDTTTLDAGPGYASYTWSTGETTQSINNVSVGSYWVLLKSREGDCVTKQEVKVYPFKSPVISNIEIGNGKITISVVGGSAPYKYSIDKITWQDSNTFENIARGVYKVYVKDSNDCDPIEIEVTVPNITNVITPNGDGFNDTIDLSGLASKKNLEMSIYDRYGVKIHQADKSNKYVWNGTIKGERLSTGTYWYTITWNENDSKSTPVKYSGWILLKNKE